jgi:hypothetical protein
MAIRLRTVAGVRIAVCAARSVAKHGDVYLDDADHYALTVKFSQVLSRLNDAHARLVEQEESNNPARKQWDDTWGHLTEVDHA